MILAIVLLAISNIISWFAIVNTHNNAEAERAHNKRGRNNMMRNYANLTERVDNLEVQP